MGCFQVFEDHEGIEADLLRRLAVLGGRLEARSAGQRPALLVLPPRRSPRPHRSRLPHRPAARGSAPAGAGAPGSQRRQLWCRPPQHPHYLQPDRRPAVDGPPAGTGHRSGAGGGAAGVPLAALSRLPTPGGPGSGRSPSAAGGPPGTALLPPPIKSRPLRLTNLPS